MESVYRPVEAISSTLCQSIILNQERVILEEARKKLGQEISIEDITKRLKRVIYKDGTEIIQLDGQAILIFQPVRFNQTLEGLRIKIQAKQDYKSYDTGCMNGTCKHASDCSVHNGEDAGECDCGLVPNTE